jgi:hypothetical protein
MKLTSRVPHLEVNQISRLVLNEGDILVAQPDLLSRMSPANASIACDAIARGLGELFPDHRVLVMDKSVAITVVTVQP